MKRDKVTPRNQRKKMNRSVSPHNTASKSKRKNCFPAPRQAEKENDPINTKKNKSIKICLDLASYHQKESQVLKMKNIALQEQLQDQMRDMEGLRSELNKIKIAISAGATVKKDYDQLKTENGNLRKDNDLLREELKALVIKVDELTQELTSLKGKGKQTESIFVETNSNCQFELNPVSFVKESRRQEYTNKYQSITFVPSVVCLECRKKDNELEDAKIKYSDELRSLQEIVIGLERNQTAIQIMEKQLLAKNKCIDYLMTQLNLLENDSKAILQNMGSLQVKLRDVTAENVMLKAQALPSDRLYSSFTKSVA